MSDIDALVSEALQLLGVSDVGAIGAPGGQKVVRHVQSASGNQVLKVISLGDSGTEALRRAEREVQLLASLKSENVVRVSSELVELGGNPPSGAAWLEEFLDGEDLTAWLGPLRSWQDTAAMGVQVARGLAAGHEVGVVHRDLSSNNIRRLSSGMYKVMDFGFARHTLRSGLTVAGQPGTPGFLTPEHLNSYSGGPSAASDVFALGNLMYFALTGNAAIPWRGDEYDYSHRLYKVEIIDLKYVRPDLADPQIALIRRCLHPQPARRYRNGSRLAVALENLT
jgi:serine/threonine protein kinase